MKTGDTITIRFKRQSILSTGSVAGASGKVVGDHVTTVNGSTVTLGSFTEIGTVGSWTEYSGTTTAPSTAGLFSVTVQTAAGTDIISPSAFLFDVMAYDDAALANLLLTTQGIPSVLSAADSSLGDIVDGDSYLSSTLTMPAGKLSPFSITNIAAVGITVEAAIMLAPNGTSYPITAAVVSGPGLTFTVGWDTQQHPAMTTQSMLVWSMDVQVIKTGPPKQIITTNRYTFNQVWQRDTRTT